MRSYIIRTFHNILLELSIKKDEMGGNVDCIGDTRNA
jgi:hypothetical protein